MNTGLAGDWAASGATPASTTSGNTARTNCIGGPLCGVAVAGAMAGDHYNVNSSPNARRVGPLLGFAIQMPQPAQGERVATASFRPRHVSRSAVITVELPFEVTLELFSREGVRQWVDDWERE